jgi:hypothetical protein
MISGISLHSRTTTSAADHFFYDNVLQKEAAGEAFLPLLSLVVSTNGL